MRAIAGHLPRFGVTAFCPTSLACSPDALRGMLQAVRVARTTRVPGGARVLPAHLESNFINPDYKGAQPLECLRRPPSRQPTDAEADGVSWGGREILDEIAAARPDVGIITMAPELPDALDLIRDLTSHGHHVSLGHSGATYEEALEGVRAGARHATHLFNRTRPMTHRAPGLTGAGTGIRRDHRRAGLRLRSRPSRRDARRAGGETTRTGDGDHRRHRRLRPALRRPRAHRRSTINISDAAYLDDGTLAGSVLTMDRAFANLVTRTGLGLADAAVACSTTPARALGLQGFGVIAAGAAADLVVLDRELRVRQTWISGSLAYDGLSA